MGRLTEKLVLTSGECIGAITSAGTQEIDFLKFSGGFLQVVDIFCYLYELINSGRECTRSVSARIRIGWSKFREFLPLLATKGFSLKVKGRLYDACVQTTMLHGSETF